MEMILEHPVSSTRKGADAVRQNRCKEPRSAFLERTFTLDKAGREFSHLLQALVLGEAMGFLDLELCGWKARFGWPIGTGLELFDT
ncbi:MAG: hypothetical protein QF473_18465 [Planctomycetota bacterium]|jgi:hypothetical protein|nr:hypothetical protein [Planctomycetota bacterium]